MDITFKVKVRLKKEMVDGRDEALNASWIEGPRVPVEVRVKSGRSWGS